MKLFMIETSYSCSLLLRTYVRMWMLNKKFLHVYIHYGHAFLLLSALNMAENDWIRLKWASWIYLFESSLHESTAYNSEPECTCTFSVTCSCVHGSCPAVGFVVIACQRCIAPSASNWTVWLCSYCTGSIILHVCDPDGLPCSHQWPCNRRHLHDPP